MRTFIVTGLKQVGMGLLATLLLVWAIQISPLVQPVFNHNMNETIQVTHSP